MSVRSRTLGAASAAALMVIGATATFAGSGPDHGNDMGMQPGGTQPGMMMGRGGMSMTGMGMMGMMGGCPMMGGRMQGMAAAHAEGRAAFLRAELAITDAQKSVWDAYAAALKKSLGNMQSMHQTMMKARETASPVERLEIHIAAMEGRLTTLKELKAPLAALYGALSDDQKKKADDLMTGMGCMM